MSVTRSRWAAIGAAVAVTLGAGGVGVSRADTGTGDRPIYVPIEPCRLADTRPAPDTVGPRTAALGPDETYTLDGWGATGDCTLPAGTSALSLNVTAVGATQQTNLRFFPAGAAVPTAANLNPTPGAPPTPNAVIVGLDDTAGEFSVFNKFGSVAVIIDVAGYFDHHVHDDIYYTEAEVDTALGLKADNTSVYTQAEIDTALGLKADATSVYTQAEVDAIVSELETMLTTYYTIESSLQTDIPAWTGGQPARGTEAVMCGPGDIAVGGGFDSFMGSTFDSDLVFEESRLVETPAAQGWQVTARNENTGSTGSFNLWVTCLDATP